MDSAMDLNENPPKWLPGFMKPLWSYKGSIFWIILVVTCAFAARYIIAVGKEVDFDFSAKLDAANKVFEFNCKAKPPQ